MKRRPKLRIAPYAESEVEEAAHWYEDREPGLGAAFVAAFRDVLPRIESAPDSFPPVPGIDLDLHVRSARMKPFPYRVVFVPDDEGVRVISVVHVRRRPGSWKHRVAQP